MLGNVKRSITQLFRQFILRGFLATLAAGLLVAGATVTAAYAAGTASGGNSAAASHAKSGTAAAANPHSPASTNGGSAGGVNTASSGNADKPPKAPGSPASTNSANGNKGHLQIEGALDCGTSPCGEDNDPHLSCSLTVELFGYPSGPNSATVTIAGQQPSGSGTVLTDSFTFQGSSSPGGNILDAYKTYPLSAAQLTGAGLTPQPQQGYHLRIEVAVNGFHAKTHVVWLQPCTTAPVIPGSSAGALLPGDTPSADTGLTGTPGLLRPTAGRAPGTVGADALAADTPAPGSPSMTAALTAAPAHVAADSRPSGRLAFTGIGLGLAIALIVAALGVGSRLLVLSRRAKRVSV